MYSSISEAPDPYPLLEASVESIVTADETVPRLEADNRYLRSQVSNLTSQLEESEKRLETETSAKQALQESQDSSVKEVESSWSAVLTEKQDNWDAQKKSLEEHGENQERLLKELKASYEVSQRLDRNAENDDANQLGGFTTAELEIVTSDLERANQRLADVEARNEQLRVELAQSTTQATRSGPVEEDPAYLRLRSKNSSLLCKVDAARFERESAHREVEAGTLKLKREIATLTHDSEGLKAKLAKCADYEDVKRELEVLKSIEFATGDNDAADEDTVADTPDQPPISVSSINPNNQNLEQLLLARNKKLNNELTVLRVSHQDLSTRLNTLQEDLSTTNMEFEKSRALTAQLEDDIASLQHPSSLHTTAPSIAPTYSSRHPYRKGSARAASPTSSIISGFEAGSNFHGEHTAGSSSSILPMLTAQRDRFKTRNAALESDLQKAYQTVSSLRSEIASLQKDNLNLYERTRYAASFPRAQPSGPPNPNPATIEIGGGGGTDRYKSVYEGSLSPFAAFRGRESARVMRRMSLPERSAFKFLRTVLSTRTSRNVFVVYFLGLHVLLVWMLWADARVAREVAVVGASGVVGRGGVGGGAGVLEKAGDWAHGEFQDVG